jgi:hypothetical protein
MNMKTGVKVALGLGITAGLAGVAFLVYSNNFGQAAQTINETIRNATNDINNPSSPYENKFLNVKGSDQYWIVKNGMKHLLPSNNYHDYPGLIDPNSGPWVSQQLIDSIPTGDRWTRVATKSDLSGLRELGLSNLLR